MHRTYKVGEAQNCLKPKILYLRSRQGRFAALKATQMEDFGLQAILEKRNSLISPLIKGPLGNFQFFLKIFGQFVKVHCHMKFNVN